jgi:hypothetical protein
MAKAVDWVPNRPKRDILESLSQDSKLVVAQIDDDVVLVKFKAPRYVAFSGMNAQRVLLRFSEAASQLTVRCEVRPFYSSYLLGSLIAGFTIAVVVSENTRSEILETVIVSLAGLCVGCAVCNFFHPSPSTSYIEDRMGE